MPTEPWLAYPPEMNVTRIVGPGPAPWLAAAAIWAFQAAEASAAQGTFQAQNGVQVANLDGATSNSVAATVPAFSAWLADLTAEASRSALEHYEVAQSYTAAFASMVPLPVIAANRAAAAAGHAATAVGAVNPAGVAADAEYARYTIQNAAAMESYDTTAQIATTPRVYAAPPKLVNGMGDVSTSGDVVNAVARSANLDSGSVAKQVQAMQPRFSDPTFIQNLQSNVASGTGQFAATPVALSPAQVQQAQLAMVPAQMVMGQMATPGPGGVTYTGLGSGSGAMAPAATSGSSSGSGLPIRSGGVSGGSSLGSYAGSGGSLSSLSGSGGGGGGGVSSSPNLSSLARMLAGSGGGGGGGLPQALSGGVKAFSGVPLGAGEGGGGAGAPAQARGGAPMGGAPLGAGGGGGGSRKGSKMEAEEVIWRDTVAEDEADRQARAMFR